MYALHPGSLPPKTIEGDRTQVTADDLVRLYRLQPYEFILWDPADGYDWHDFIHLWPMYYGNYALTDGTPAKDLPATPLVLRGRPCVPSRVLSGGRRGGKGSRS